MIKFYNIKTHSAFKKTHYAFLYYSAVGDLPAAVVNCEVVAVYQFRYRDRSVFCTKTVQECVQCRRGIFRACVHQDYVPVLRLAKDSAQYVLAAFGFVVQAVHRPLYVCVPGIFTSGKDVIAVLAIAAADKGRIFRCERGKDFITLFYVGQNFIISHFSIMPMIVRM